MSARDYILAGLLLVILVALVLVFVLPAPPQSGRNGFSPGWRCEPIPDGHQMCSRDPGPVLRH